jgi:GT2 family glycosyltransferase
MTPSATIVIPTRARLQYLEAALRSIAPQAAEVGAEVVVVDDAGSSAATRELAERFDARYVAHPGPLGINVARNTGVAHSSGQLVVFVDDDVEVRGGWLEALLDAARRLPEVDVFTGPIRPRLEGRPPRSCGREGPAITSLDLGWEDTDARYAWGANMAVRRAALERVGPFDESLEQAGDEQEWQDRLRAAGPGRVVYVAAAALDHRRTAADSRLRALARAARARGSASRRFDAWRGTAPSLRRELLTLAGCAGHAIRYRCAGGLVLTAHSAGRVHETLRRRTQPRVPASPRAVAQDADFLSGASGTVGGLDGLRRRLGDAAIDAREIASGRRARLARAARSQPPARRVLVLGVERPEHRALSAAIRAELATSRHEVELHLAPPGTRGKFENIDALLSEHPAAAHDWLLVVDDDVSLPRGFLDRFLFLAERFELALAQPAHRLASHAAWEVTRRRPHSAVRETAFVEIGPVTAFAQLTFTELLPFPPLRMGWGLDAHWAAIARQRGWRCGVVDAVAIGHRAAPAASAYPREAAIAEARAFLADRPYLTANEAQVTLATHERW